MIVRVACQTTVRGFGQLLALPFTCTVQRNELTSRTRGSGKPNVAYKVRNTVIRLDNDPDIETTSLAPYMRVKCLQTRVHMLMSAVSVLAKPFS